LIELPIVSLVVAYQGALTKMKHAGILWIAALGAVAACLGVIFLHPSPLTMMAAHLCVFAIAAYAATYLTKSTQRQVIMTFGICSLVLAVTTMLLITALFAHSGEIAQRVSETGRLSKEQATRVLEAVGASARNRLPIIQFVIAMMGSVIGMYLGWSARSRTRRSGSAA
jgi:uncharacterized membrane protein